MRLEANLHFSHTNQLAPLNEILSSFLNAPPPLITIPLPPPIEFVEIPVKGLGVVSQIITGVVNSVLAVANHARKCTRLFSDLISGTDVVGHVANAVSGVYKTCTHLFSLLAQAMTADPHPVPVPIRARPIVQNPDPILVSEIIDPAPGIPLPMIDNQAISGEVLPSGNILRSWQEDKVISTHHISLIHLFADVLTVIKRELIEEKVYTSDDIAGMMPNVYYSVLDRTILRIAETSVSDSRGITLQSSDRNAQSDSLNTIRNVRSNLNLNTITDSICSQFSNIQKLIHTFSSAQIEELKSYSTLKNCLENTKDNEEKLSLYSEKIKKAYAAITEARGVIDKKIMSTEGQSDPIVNWTAIFG